MKHIQLSLQEQKLPQLLELAYLLFFLSLWLVFFGIWQSVTDLVHKQ